METFFISILEKIKKNLKKYLRKTKFWFEKVLELKGSKSI